MTLQERAERVYERITKLIEDIQSAQSSTKTEEEKGELLRRYKGLPPQLGFIKTAILSIPVNQSPEQSQS